MYLHMIDSPTVPCVQLKSALKAKLWPLGQVAAHSRSISISFPYTHTHTHAEKIAAVGSQPTSNREDLPRVRRRGGWTAYHSSGAAWLPDETDRCHLVILLCKSPPRSTGSWLAWTCCRIYLLTYGTCQFHKRTERPRCSGDAGRPKISSAAKQNCQQYGTDLWHLDVIIVYQVAWGIFRGACFAIWNEPKVSAST